MKVLFDENTPVQLVPALTAVLPLDEVFHVDDLKWKSKKDGFLIPDAARRGFEALVTLDRNQLDDPSELAAIRKAGIHHVRFRQANGSKGLARALGSVVATMPDVLEELRAADGQRLVRIVGLEAGRRHEIVDPVTTPPAYWGR